MLQHLEDLRDKGKRRISYSSPVKMRVMLSMAPIVNGNGSKSHPGVGWDLHNLHEVMVIWVPALRRSHPF